MNLRQFDQVKPDFLAINPLGLVPVLEDHGELITESRIINEYLEEAYPGVSLLPSAAHERARVRNLTRQIDLVVSEAVKLPSFASNIQPALQAEDRDAVLAKIERIPDPAIQTRWRSAATGSIQPADCEGALMTLREWLSQLEATLTRYVWLSGEEVGLADVDAVPFVQRMLRIGMRTDVLACPHVATWFDRYSRRPAFLSSMPALGSESQVPV